jgi:hypoxanthine phosphoribosyltransferase
MKINNFEITPYITEADIKAKIKELAETIDKKIKNYKEPALALCVLKGSFIFFSDIIRELKTDIKCDFLGTSSYGLQDRSSGEVKLTLDLASSITGQNIILFEDIVDTGLTLNFLVESLKARRPESITTVALLDKPTARKTDFKVDHTGFVIPDEFVVGYGLDYAEQFRQLPYIAKLANNSVN